MQQFDIGIIGGGIHGMGVAALASQLGLSVFLCEKQDFASLTSSQSSKLIHGGLRYLQYGAFHLVFESLKARNQLFEKAPFLVHPQRFLIPTGSSYTRLQYRVGLFLYDLLSWPSPFPRSSNCAFVKSLRPEFQTCLSYYDCKTDDARLVLTVAKLAKSHGAILKRDTELLQAKANGSDWDVTTFDHQKKRIENWTCNTLINAAGPYVNDVMLRCGFSDNPKIKWVKGSHIILKGKITEDAFLLPQPDKRVVFLIPYEEHYTLIGTTDILLNELPQTLKISQEEIDYLLTACNRYLQSPITQDQIIHDYSGVRTLFDTDKPARSLSREEYIPVHAHGQAKLISIIGGKLTTYEAIARKVLKKISWMPSKTRATSFLPGAYLKKTC